MKYKVGDKVRVRTDMKPYQELGAYCFIHAMIPFIGKTLTVRSVDNGCECYDVIEDNDEFCWTDGMLEPIGGTL